MIDNDGNARLAIGSHNSIMAVPGTSLAGYLQSSVEGDLGDCRYLAPELQWPEDYGMDKILMTKEGDIYGMAMVIYEARSYKPTSPMRYQISCVFPRSWRALSPITIASI